MRSTVPSTLILTVPVEPCAVNTLPCAGVVNIILLESTLKITYVSVRPTIISCACIPPVLVVFTRLFSEPDCVIAVTSYCSPPVLIKAPLSLSAKSVCSIAPPLSATSTKLIALTAPRGSASAITVIPSASYTGPSALPRRCSSAICVILSSATPVKSSVAVCNSTNPSVAVNSVSLNAATPKSD